MTVSGQRSGAANVAAPSLGHRAAVRTSDPLPPGWTHFCSHSPDANPASRWYASAPWLAYRAGPGAQRLSQTVYADTWPELYAAVTQQEKIYNSLGVEYA